LVRIMLKRQGSYLAFTIALLACLIPILVVVIDPQWLQFR